MKLAAYLAKEALTQTQFAERVGVDQATVSRWLAGAFPRNPSIRRRIIEATGGEVSFASWLEVEGENATPPSDATQASAA